MNIQEIEDDKENDPTGVSSVDSVLETEERPVVLRFSAEWCKPCQETGPAFEAMCKDMEGKIATVRVDSDENQDVFEKFFVSQMPTFVVARNGAERFRTQDVEELQRRLRDMTRPLVLTEDF